MHFFQFNLHTTTKISKLGKSHHGTGKLNFLKLRLHLIEESAESVLLSYASIRPGNRHPNELLDIPAACIVHGGDARSTLGYQLMRTFIPATFGITSPGCFGRIADKFTTTVEPLNKFKRYVLYAEFVFMKVYDFVRNFFCFNAISVCQKQKIYLSAKIQT